MRAVVTPPGIALDVMESRIVLALQILDRARSLASRITFVASANPYFSGSRCAAWSPSNAFLWTFSHVATFLCLWHEIGMTLRYNVLGVAAFGGSGV